MADPTKHLGPTIVTDLKGLLSIFKTRRTVAFAYGFMFAFVGFTIFMMLNPSSNSSSPWFTNIFTTNTKTTIPVTSTDSYRSQFSSVFSYFFPNSNNSFTTRESGSSSSSSPPAQHQQQQQVVYDGSPLNQNASKTGSAKPERNPVQNTTKTSPVSDKGQVLKPDPVLNTTESSKLSDKDAIFKPNHTSNAPSPFVNVSPPTVNSTSHDVKLPVSKQSQTDALKIEAPKAANNGTDASSKQTGVSDKKNRTETAVKSVADTKGVSKSNYTAVLSKKHNNGSVSGLSAKQESDGTVESLMKCDLFDGGWVEDESYPLYKPGSCSLIDEQFNCVINGRPDREYQKFKWKPKKCSLPRLNATHMLEMLRGKRLVFVGDSLNRNMWESLVCILRGSVKDKRKVYEVNGRHHFRGEAPYSFVFEDYNCTVEFFVSPFLVREWEMPDKNGSAHETLRLDLMGRSCDQYKDADIIIFNTGHWWTHEKTSKGNDYYQEGSHVYGELNVLEAFRKALTTWARWVDASINPMKSLVFFRGYSASHFSGGQWNSGGQCDSETEPIKNEKYLREYPPKMAVLEKVLRGMKTHVTYLNITRMTDYRKDGHPSIYRKQNLNDAERRSPLTFQDCSHWCLPGVPDAWNEILYSELLVKLKQRVIQEKGH